ncbi:LysM domain protein [Pelotomaculum sp. FP]|uniref:LysM peptidoglycan-binding domain-containing protein n=1 Tax=Pelotomaculum sp. FP TaxID=261474 RepID=UPI001065D594|nr:LysM peptidoglycan-binding domain-containing protein [Pelotomaculum sp. FP]TEB16950.1 LysM domain protein [Pelotomaculum sp. FP]
MPLSLTRLLWSRELDGPVLVNWGVITGERTNLVATSGTNLFLFSPSDDGYSLSAALDIGTEVLSLAVGLPGPALDNIVVGLEDRVAVYGSREGTLLLLAETAPESGARYVDVALADIDNDGREEVIAAAEGRNALYFYRQTGQAPGEVRLDLLAIRALPGAPQKVAVVMRSGDLLPLTAAAYSTDGSSGIITLIFTERGFAEGPAQENLSARVASLTAGNLRERLDEQLAWGGQDGFVRVVEVNQELNTVLTTDNLGSSVPALTAGRLVGDGFETLVAGTPEGYLFGFSAPVQSTSPDWALQAGRSVNDLEVSSEGLLGLGTRDGWLQVWLLSGRGKSVHAVVPGDTLTSIARNYNTTMEAIIELNSGLNPDLIFAGQYLAIP